MPAPITFDNVSKKFSRGERHDSLRDLVPSLIRRTILGRGSADVLGGKEFWAVRDVSFAVEPGEALGIVGPNGAGKSTILKLLTRILRPTVGHCAVVGRVGALIEVAAGFHPDLTGRENVFFQGAIMGMKRDEILQCFDEIVEFAGIEAFIDTPVKRYSSGMNARLGFSIAAHLRPDVLVIDEVLSVGDVAFQQKCFARMQGFLDRGVAVVFVTHNLLAATQLCRRTLLLVRGEVATVGPTHETVATYASLATPGSNTSTASDSVALQVEVPGRPRNGVWSVRPGASIRLTVTVAFREELRNVSVGIVVWDLVRNLYVYGAASDAIGLPLLHGTKGQSVSFDFDFVANLSRGTYVVEVNTSDSAQQRRLGVLKPAAQFTVVEEITYDGIANLFLSGTPREVSSEVR